MSIANLTRYMFKYGGDESCGCDVLDSKDFEFEGGYVKFEEAMEASSNSLQQLKAEIASRVTKLESYAREYDVSNDFWDIIEELRQLSAV